MRFSSIDVKSGQNLGGSPQHRAVNNNIHIKSQVHPYKLSGGGLISELEGGYKEYTPAKKQMLQRDTSDFMLVESEETKRIGVSQNISRSSLVPKQSETKGREVVNLSSKFLNYAGFDTIQSHGDDESSSNQKIQALATPKKNRGELASKDCLFQKLDSEDKFQNGNIYEEMGGESLSELSPQQNYGFFAYEKLPSSKKKRNESKGLAHESEDDYRIEVDKGDYKENYYSSNQGNNYKQHLFQDKESPSLHGNNSPQCLEEQLIKKSETFEKSSQLKTSGVESGKTNKEYEAILRYSQRSTLQGGSLTSSQLQQSKKYSMLLQSSLESKKYKNQELPEKSIISKEDKRVKKRYQIGQKVISPTIEENQESLVQSDVIDRVQNFDESKKGLIKISQRANSGTRGNRDVAGIVKYGQDFVQNQKKYDSRYGSTDQGIQEVNQEQIDDIDLYPDQQQKEQQEQEYLQQEIEYQLQQQQQQQQEQQRQEEIYLQQQEMHQQYLLKQQIKDEEELLKKEADLKKKIEDKNKIKQVEQERLRKIYEQQQFKKQLQKQELKKLKEEEDYIQSVQEEAGFEEQVKNNHQYPIKENTPSPPKQEVKTSKIEKMADKFSLELGDEAHTTPKKLKLMKSSIIDPENLNRISNKQPLQKQSLCELSDPLVDSNINSNPFNTQDFFDYDSGTALGLQTFRSRDHALKKSPQFGNSHIDESPCDNKGQDQPQIQDLATSQFDQQNDLQEQNDYLSHNQNMASRNLDPYKTSPEQLLSSSMIIDNSVTELSQNEYELQRQRDDVNVNLDQIKIKLNKMVASEKNMSTYTGRSGSRTPTISPSRKMEVQGRKKSKNKQLNQVLNTIDTEIHSIHSRIDNIMSFLHFSSSKKSKEPQKQDPPHQEYQQESKTTRLEDQEGNTDRRRAVSSKRSLVDEKYGKGGNRGKDLDLELTGLINKNLKKSFNLSNPNPQRYKYPDLKLNREASKDLDMNVVFSSSSSLNTKKGRSVSLHNTGHPLNIRTKEITMKKVRRSPSSAMEMPVQIENSFIALNTVGSPQGGEESQNLVQNLAQDRIRYNHNTPIDFDVIQRNINKKKKESASLKENQKWKNRSQKNLVSRNGEEESYLGRYRSKNSNSKKSQNNSKRKQKNGSRLETVESHKNYVPITKEISLEQILQSAKKGVITTPLSHLSTAKKEDMEIEYSDQGEKSQKKSLRALKRGSSAKKSNSSRKGSAQKMKSKSRRKFAHVEGIDFNDDEYGLLSKEYIPFSQVSMIQGNPTSKNSAQKKSAKKKKSVSRKRHNQQYIDRIYEEAKIKKVVLEEKRQNQAKIQEIKDMENCTFKPKTTNFKKTLRRITNKMKYGTSRSPGLHKRTKSFISGVYPSRRSNSRNRVNGLDREQTRGNDINKKSQGQKNKRRESIRGFESRRGSRNIKKGKKSKSRNGSKQKKSSRKLSMRGKEEFGLDTKWNDTNADGYSNGMRTARRVQGASKNKTKTKSRRNLSENGFKAPKPLSQDLRSYIIQGGNTARPYDGGMILKEEKEDEYFDFARINRMTRPNNTHQGPLKSKYQNSQKNSNKSSLKKSKKKKKGILNQKEESPVNGVERKSITIQEIKDLKMPISTNEIYYDQPIITTQIDLTTNLQNKMNNNGKPNLQKFESPKPKNIRRQTPLKNNPKKEEFYYPIDPSIDLETQLQNEIQNSYLHKNFHENKAFQDRVNNLDGKMQEAGNLEDEEMELYLDDIDALEKELRRQLETEELQNEMLESRIPLQELPLKRYDVCSEMNIERSPKSVVKGSNESNTTIRRRKKGEREKSQTKWNASTSFISKKKSKK